METAAPRGGYGSLYSSEARLFVRGLARESGWLALTGPREGQAGVTAAPGSLGGLTPPERVTGDSQLDSLHSISALIHPPLPRAAAGAGEAAFVEFAAFLKGDDAK